MFDSVVRRAKSKGRRRIKLSSPKLKGSVIVVKIKHQTHRGEDFGVCGSEFLASNGVVLKSDSYPTGPGHVLKEVVRIRGRCKYLDKEPILFTSLQNYNKFVEAVNEYNEYFSKPRVKEMTMEEICRELGYEVKIKKGN